MKHTENAPEGAEHAVAMVPVEFRKTEGNVLWTDYILARTSHTPSVLAMCLMQ